MPSIERNYFFKRWGVFSPNLWQGCVTGAIFGFPIKPKMPKENAPVVGFVLICVPCVVIPIARGRPVLPRMDVGAGTGPRSSSLIKL